MRWMATIILDFGGDRRTALAALAERFGLTKRDEQKKVAALLFRLIRQRASQEEIERQAYAEGERLGLSRAEVIHCGDVGGIADEGSRIDGRHLPELGRGEGGR